MSNNIRINRKYLNGGQQDGAVLGMLGSVGMASGNPYGMAAGALLTGAGSLMAAKKQREDAAKAEALMKSQQVESDTRMNAQFLSTYRTKIGGEMYKNGGLLKKYSAGGVIPISPEAGVVKGPSHENGGVDMGNGNEVEGGEVVTVGGKVFSKENGFADEALQVTQSSLYKKFINQKTAFNSLLEDVKTNAIDKSTAQRELEKLVDPLDVVFEKQHQYNVANGLPEGGEKATNEMANGGMMKRKYDNGNGYNTLLPNTYNALNPKKPVIEQPLGIESTVNEIANYGSNSLLYPKKPLSVLKNNIVTNTGTPYENLLPLTNKALNTKQIEYPSMNANLVPNTTPTTPETPNVLNGNSLLKGSQFMDNALNFYLTRNTPQIPNQSLNVAPRLDTELNIKPQLQEQRNQLTAMSKNIDRQTTDKGNAMSNKQAAFANTLKGTNELMGNKANAELGLRNEAAKIMADTTNSNNAIIQNNKMQQAMRLGDIQSRDSKNIENIVGDIKYANIDKQEQANDKLALSMYSTALNKNGVVNRNLKTEIMQMLNFTTDEEYNNWTKKNKLTN